MIVLSVTRFKVLPCAGTYFQLLDYSDISDLQDVALARQLTIEKGIASIPISVFYENPLQEQRILRFCFAKNDETLDQATALLSAI
ncbi:aminotransferase class I/II-fold pyridoxal phosphate-dependent enzyme [Leucothrix pacifica]|uniref:Uncharacterized protein n=1 Tax=Leucothrix pacifica TaxID=1247513 RepID=A0A317CDQ0_9GAMM|nr:aminotransferase class I/II-fold pyridoxal phosphate-dependent enzyme [Leucothrix pacifica]PWQ96656.1 hypothetical protein DKW60_12805 [Leucothrix pacifica]